MQSEQARARSTAEPAAVAGPIFIVGASRSGTAMMRSIVNGHADVLVSGESHYFDDLRVRMTGRLRGTLPDADRKTCEDYFLALDHRPYGHGGDPERSDMSRQELREVALERGDGADAYFEAFCLVRARREGKRIWGDKTPRHIFRIREIVEAYPEAKVIAMVRDPRAVVASYRDWRNQGGFDLEKDPGHAEALEKEEARARASYDVILASLVWKGGAKAAISARRELGPDRVRLQGYETLVADPEGEARKLCEWLGVAFSPAMLDVPMHNSSFSSFEEKSGVKKEAAERWRTRLSPREIGVVQSVCGSFMDEVGFERADVRASPAYVAWRWGVFPFKAARAVWVNRDRMGNVPAYLWRRVRSLAGR